ncbi:MAG: helix-turn-helix domain-containing protein [Rhodoferax sp.]|nr:helix-turn-helix domain-containing protein [Rhodoferax sp.]
MDVSGIDLGLVQSLEALSKFGLWARTSAPLNEQAATWARLASEAVVAATPAFNATAGPERVADLERHAGAHITELCRLLDGGAVRDFEFVRAYARQRATQRFPIEATLHAYRFMLPMVSRWLRDGVVTPQARNREPALAALAEFVTQYNGAVSIVFAAAYAEHASVFAEAEGDRRAELLGILVGGFEESDTRIVRLLKRAGYLEQRLRFCVALAQATDPLEMENTARAQRLADALVECVAPLSVRVLVGVRGNLVTAVFSDIRRVSGWTAPQASLTDRVAERLLGLGPAVLVGLSGDQVSPTLIPRGVHEATVALDFATVSERVVPFYSLSIRRLLIHRGVEYVQPALPAWFARLRDADAKCQGDLVNTLRALANADMNVQGAARGLHVHANTIYARLQRIEDLTGLNAQRYHDLTQLLLAADCGRL